jgi:hypothetical protein
MAHTPKAKGTKIAGIGEFKEYCTTAVAGGQIFHKRHRGLFGPDGVLFRVEIRTHSTFARRKEKRRGARSMLALIWPFYHFFQLCGYSCLCLNPYLP